ncbi:hypothetical protein BJ973_002607 [Actinoplanes tereljensis]|uniref:Glycoside-hydrolase family GH114 TIM-barrel domain-containing protein n=1 Tax=Paractinoplanes tereljensis TaxID=571912 RepID=A0A919NPG9_9ACTN|nr:endo alpha-1,4 polygalactosaminidase [Actinoplanes tereljensis]GIF22283.1 hypothetical protein Ate02nite_50130 [Actinoplanes tereljensis]
MRVVAALLLVTAVLGGCREQSPVEGMPTVAWENPPANGRFDYQLGGAYPPAAGVAIVDRDRTAQPAPGVYSICYVNAFQTQPAENTWWSANHDDLLLRSKGDGYLTDPDWPGERILDISTDAKRAALAGIVGDWFAGCAKQGFRAVEPDNLDSYTRSNSRLKQSDSLAYARLLKERAHREGLAIAQKNAPDLAGLGFDFAVAEECAVYDECDAYRKIYGEQVYEIEYTDNGIDAYRQACRADGDRISIILRDRDVVPVATPGYHYEFC